MLCAIMDMAVVGHNARQQPRSDPSQLGMTSTIKILCLMEATTVTGPAKNLLNFCRLTRSREFYVDESSRVEVSLVTFDRATGANSAKPNAFMQAFRDEGITVDVIPERFRFDPLVITKLCEIAARRAPDLIQTHMIKSHFLIKLSGLGKKYPWIAYHHGYTTTDLKMQIYNQLNRWSLPSATRVITVCDQFAKHLIKTGVPTDRISVRHNSVVAPRKVSDKEQQTLRQKLAIDDGDRMIVTIGRLSREKGHVDLIRSLVALRELNPKSKFKLLIVGDGPERESLIRAIAEQSLSTQVVFVGQVEDVAPYYALADALALPSHSEGSPNVLLEAMAAGVPIVATTIGGVPEIATTGESALLVPPRDPQAFGNALHRLLTNKDLAKSLGAKARTRANDFSPESHARSLINIYEGLFTIPAPLSQPELISV